MLYQCGTAAPAAESLPEGAKLFQIPLVSVSVPETVPYAAMVSIYLLAPYSHRTEREHHQESPDHRSPGGMSVARGRAAPALVSCILASPIVMSSNSAYSLRCPSPLSHTPHAYKLLRPEC